ncbi:MAG TPA: hypothetical protein VK832_20600 [Burkholderiaceae bacterium]|nr:hypothetical protein [Burkholderiaceae bacterium]
MILLAQTDHLRAHGQSDGFNVIPSLARISLNTAAMAWMISLSGLASQ